MTADPSSDASRTSSRLKRLFFGLLAALVVFTGLIGGYSADKQKHAIISPPPPVAPPTFKPHVQRWDKDDYPQGTLRVLFIGNSLTFYNDLPCIVQEMTANEAKPLEIEFAAFGGWTLKKHWEFKKALKLITENGPWDYVVLQGYSNEPITDMAGFFKYAHLFNDEIIKTGAKTVLYMTWAKKDRPKDQAVLTEAYEILAKELGAILAPVGEAWKAALTRDPELVLHQKDNKHPVPSGSYLAACVFYNLFYQKPSRGLPGKLELKQGRVLHKLDLDPRESEYLQIIADDVLNP